MRVPLDLLPTRRLCLRYGLLAGAWLLLPARSVALSLMFPGPGGVAAPAVIVANLYLDMVIPEANGTTVETTMLAAGSHHDGTTVNVWFTQCTGVCGMTVEAGSALPPAPIRVGSTTYRVDPCRPHYPHGP